MAHFYILGSFMLAAMSLRTTSLLMNNNYGDELLFFNVRRRKPLSLAPLSSARYKKNGPVIATLVTNSTKDTDELRLSLQSLMFLQGDDPDHPAPVLVFNEGDLSGKQVQLIVSSTNRPVAFPIVDLTTFPPGFQSEQEDGGPQYLVKNRKPWGYYQMIRFWITGYVFCSLQYDIVK